MERESIKHFIEMQLSKQISFFQIITKEPYVVAEILDDILPRYQVKEIIHYDILQGFDVPTKETAQQMFPETIDKWLYEKSLESVALVISGSDKILENESAVLAIRKMVCDKSKRICSKPVFVIIISDNDCLPLQLRDIGIILNTPLMNLEECTSIVKDVLGDKCQYDISKISKELLGLTERQVRICLAEKLSDSGNEGDFSKSIRERKASLLNQSGLITIEDDCDVEDLGGFEGLKNWLEEIKTIPDEEDSIFPKGMLLVGVTGCGKSLAARVSSRVLGFPLLRVDFGRLMNKYVGESEKNLVSALQIVEATAPCVLWMDEFEKAFGGSDENSGVSQRMLGQFLTWLQERKEKVFTVATVNNISKLPPELLRRGRFDKIYYVDLPNDDERKSIIKIHANKVGLNLSETDIASISSNMSGKAYSGADIEYLMKETKRMYHYLNSKRNDVEQKKNDAELVKECLTNTTPVGSIMSIEIKEMREEFSSRGFDNVNSNYSENLEQKTAKMKGRKNKR